MNMFEDSHLDDDISSFIEQNRNVNTTKKTKTDLNVWKRWCQSVKETRSLEDIPPEELDNVSSHFFIKVRKINGEDFEPGTPTQFFSEIQTMNMTHDPFF